MKIGLSHAIDNKKILFLGTQKVNIDIPGIVFSYKMSHTLLHPENNADTSWTSSSFLALRQVCSSKHAPIRRYKYVVMEEKCWSIVECVSGSQN